MTSPEASSLSNSDKRWGFSLRVTILTAFAVLLILTVVAIAGDSYLRNRRNVLAQSDALIEQVTRTVIQEVAHYLSPAAKTVALAANLTEEGVLSLERLGELERFGIAVLGEYPHIARFDVGDEAGNFLMSLRHADGRVDTKTVRRSGPTPAVTWKRRNLEGRVIAEETSPELDFDPRTRPWYEGAKAAEGIHWTGAYALFTGRQPGVTVSRAVRDADGEVQGVLGIDLELGRLSAFLQELAVGNGVVLVANASDEVIAHSEPARAVRADGDELRLAAVHELSPDWITQAFQLHAALEENRFNYSWNGERYRASFTRLPSSLGTDWKVVLVVPEADFVGFLLRNNRIAVAIAAGVLALSILCARQISRGVSVNIRRLSEQTRQIQDFQLDAPVGVESRILEIRVMSEALTTMRGGIAAFAKYAPTALVRQLIQTGEEARIVGHTRELTVLFTDVTDFTSISETLTPEMLFVELSEYFDTLTRIIREERGTVDKFIGDSVMAFWGAPIAVEDHALLACRATLRCRDAILALNARRIAIGKPPFKTRFGMHSGPAFVGNVGSDDRMNYTAIGDTVNLASRLEGTNHVYGTGIIVSETTRRQVSDHFVFRPLDQVRVKGKNKIVQIYELVQESDHPSADELAARCARFAEALDAYLARDWDTAIAGFMELSRVDPDDRAVAVYLERCGQFRVRPPDADWDGVIDMQTK